jgi:methionyl-tRNA synthetase
VDEEARHALRTFPQTISNSIEKYRFREASQELMNLARLGNKYLADEEPWKIIKEDPERVQTVMYVALQIAAGLAVLSEPFLPFTSEKLKVMLNLPPGLSWRDVGEKDLLEPGHLIENATLLFEKIEDEQIALQLERLEQTKQANAADNEKIEPQKDTIPFEDFAKLDLRIGTILHAEKVPKTKKLMKLSVDIGFETRTVVSGIAESFEPEEVIGRKITLVANLAPRVIKGIESHGMILTTEDTAGKLAFIEPGKDKVKNGEQIS